MKSVRDIEVSGKKMFIRVDYNLPMDDAGNITDDNRIRATLDLITYLIEKGAKLILASHLGRPKAGGMKRSVCDRLLCVCPNF